MKANELRIGNCVNYKDKIIKVTMIGEYGVQSKTGYQIINAKFINPYLQPISLTEKWLLDLGFKRDEYNDKTPYYYILNGFRLNNYMGSLTLNNSNELAGFKPIEIKYVHQLQNLYFALTGEELTIK